MSDTKISEMTAATSINRGDLIPVVQGGSNKVGTALQILSTVSQITASIGDDSTDNTAVIQAELDALYAASPDGSTLLFPRGVHQASQIKIYRNQLLKSIDGMNACTLKQKASSDCDFLISENFATLTGTGSVYGIVADVPSWFGIQDMHIDGNASNQGAGDWRGIAWYGNAQLMLGHNLIENCKGSNIYTESAGGFAYSATDWRSQEEGFFDHVITRNSATGYGWLFRGPHDSTIVNLIANENALTGYRSEDSGTDYVGSAHIHFIHSYANADHTGQYYGSSSTVMESYSDFDNVTLAASGTIISKLFQIQAGQGGLSALKVTNDAKFCLVGQHTLDFDTSAINSIGVDIDANCDGFTIGASHSCLIPGTSGMTLYKIRANFCTLADVLASNASGAGSIAIDLDASYCNVKGRGFNNTTHIDYGGGNNNVVVFQAYGGTTILNGSIGNTDSFLISGDTGSSNVSPGINISSPYDSSGNFYLNNFCGALISGWYLQGYQTQFTVKGAEANDAYQYNAPTTGFSLTVDGSASYVILEPAGTLASGTITMSDIPVNGQKVIISSTQIITSLTVSPGSGQAIMNAPTSLGAGEAVGWIYKGSNSTWYRIA